MIEVNSPCHALRQQLAAIGIGLAAVAGYALVISSTNSTLVIVVGTVYVVLMALAMILARRSPHLDESLKRRMLLSVFVFVPIIWRVASVIISP